MHNKSTEEEVLSSLQFMHIKSFKNFTDIPWNPFRSPTFTMIILDKNEHKHWANGEIFEPAEEQLVKSKKEAAREAVNRMRA